MPPIRPDENPHDLVSTFEEVLDAVSKDIYTAIPSLISTYDTASRRARIRPALRRVEVDGRAFDRPAVEDVPVVWPGGRRMHRARATLKEDDAGLLGVFRCAASTGSSTPTSLRIRTSMGRSRPKDAVALPWFGKKEDLTAPRGGFVDGFTIQSDDGELSARVDTENRVVELQNGDDVRVRALRG